MVIISNLVKEEAEMRLLHSVFKVCIFEDNIGALPAEFQRDAFQVARPRSLLDLDADLQ